MSKSLFVTVESLEGYRGSLDNLMVAKVLHDKGFQFPKHTVFYVDHGYYGKQEAIFYEGVAVLFGGPICYEELPDNEDEDLIFSVRVPLIEEWHKITSTNKKADGETKWLLDLIGENGSELMMYGELTSYGLKLKIEGYTGVFYELMTKLVEFNELLNQLVEKWKPATREAAANDKKVNRIGRQRDVGNGRKAG